MASLSSYGIGQRSSAVACQTEHHRTMRIAAIVVCFFPNIDAIRCLLFTLHDADIDVVIVDNSDTAETDLFINSDLINKVEYKYIWMGRNAGIAAAQNIGVRHCIKNNYDAVFFFDQDSIVENSMVNALVESLPFGKPYVVAPVCIDKVSGIEMPTYKLNDYGLPLKIFSSPSKEPYCVDLTISSGTLVTVPTFDKVGLMDESLFIDFVDFEWFARCLVKSVPVQIVPTARMMHQIGIRSIDVGFFSTNLHSPVRTYYKVRNPLLLLRNSSVPKLYVLREIFASWVSVAVIFFVGPYRLEHLRMFFKGSVHGIKKKGGGLIVEKPRSNDI